MEGRDRPCHVQKVRQRAIAFLHFEVETSSSRSNPTDTKLKLVTLSKFMTHALQVNVSSWTDNNLLKSLASYIYLYNLSPINYCSEKLQGAMCEEGWNPVPVRGEWLLAPGVRDEHRWCWRHRGHVGEGEQDELDKHEPQLGSFLPSIFHVTRSSPLLQDHFPCNQADHRGLQCCTFLLERRFNLPSQREFPLKHIPYGLPLFLSLFLLYYPSCGSNRALT